MPVVEPLSLDDEELRIVQDCAAMLPPMLRRGFLVDFAREMKQHAEHGAGLVSRVARAVVRRHQAHSSQQSRKPGTASAQSRASARSSAEALFRQPVRQPAS
jgi:hypothetical protein